MPHARSNRPALAVEPIGFLRTGLATRVDAPRQPRAAEGLPGRIELLPGRHFEHALEDLGGWDRIWVIYWFHLNAGWRPKVLPPRSAGGRKGVFATRAPHRPNPLGLSAVRLERIDGLTLFVRDVDMVDGTPVLDIKPYVPYTDAHPAARSGWLDASAGAATADPLPPWEVTFSPLAAAQAQWVEARTGLDLPARIATTLALGPQPHPYRRIRREGSGGRLAIRDWRARFRVDGRRIEVESLVSGYRPGQLAQDETLGVHRDFVARFGAAPVPGGPP